MQMGDVKETYADIEKYKNCMVFLPQQRLKKGSLVLFNGTVIIINVRMSVLKSAKFLILLFQR